MRSTALLAAATALVLAAGCTKPKVTDAAAALVEPNYSRPLAPGDAALRLVTDPARLPDLAAAYRSRDALQVAAIDESLRWFKAPSSRTYFPIQGITHRQAEASLAAFKDLLRQDVDAATFAAEVRRRFDVYESVGYDGGGVVLFTGYYSPILQASRVRTERFTYPLYRRPADLVTDPRTGAPQGRRAADGSIVPYATRREIDTSGMFAGSELVWLESPLDGYIVHVNGSAKLRLPDQTVLYIGYAGKTDRPYASLGKALVEAGVLDAGGVSLPTIKQAYRQHPDTVRQLMFANENYVFFTEYAGHDWPAGSLGVKVTPETSLATDKRIYPRGGVVLVDTEAITFTGGARPFLRFVLDQDTGGAIDAPGRADIFMGVGPSAEILAGEQYAEGRMYYFFLKPHLVK